MWIFLYHSIRMFHFYNRVLGGDPRAFMAWRVTFKFDFFLTSVTPLDPALYVQMVRLRRLGDYPQD